MLEPNRTVAIITGASSWPNLPKFVPSEAFKKSAESLRDYLLGDPINLPEENLKWLFDTGNEPPGQYLTIEEFLVERCEKLDAESGADLLVIFAFIGHGAAWESGNAYSLVLRDTRPHLEAETSLRLRALSGLFNGVVRQSRRLFLLDACFAGEAISSMQGPEDHLLDVKAREVVERGVTVFCAAGARHGAKFDEKKGRTYFTGELVELLREGADLPSPEFSARELCGLLSDRLVERYGLDAPRPEVHSPIQYSGDLADAPLFPNPRSEGSEQMSLREAAALRVAQNDLRSALERTASILYPNEDLDHQVTLRRLGGDELLSNTNVQLAEKMLAITEEEFDNAEITSAEAMRLTHFDITVGETLAPSMLQEYVTKALRGHDWQVEPVEDPERRREGWLPDLIATRKGKRVLVAPKTATRRESKLLAGALTRLGKQIETRDVDSAVIVIPEDSQAVIPEDTRVPVVRLNDFKNRIATHGDEIFGSR